MQVIINSTRVHLNLQNVNEKKAQFLALTEVIIIKFMARIFGKEMADIENNRLIISVNQLQTDDSTLVNPDDTIEIEFKENICIRLNPKYLLRLSKFLDNYIIHETDEKSKYFPKFMNYYFVICEISCEFSEDLHRLLKSCKPDIEKKFSFKDPDVFNKIKTLSEKALQDLVYSYFIKDLEKLLQDCDQLPHQLNQILTQYKELLQTINE